MLRNNKHGNLHLQHSWNLYGETTFKFYVIEEVEDTDTLFDRENFWIEEIKSHFNQSKAGSGWNDRTFAKRDEIRLKISNTLRNNAAAMSAEERKALWGKGRKGKSLSEEHKRKTSEGLKGKTKSAETKLRMSIAQKKDNPKRRQSMSETGKKNKGRTPSTAVKYEIDGVQYKSGAEAMIALNLTSRQLYKMVLNGTAKRNKTKKL